MSQIEASELGERFNNESVMSNYNMNPTERRIQLLNAKTLKPYIKTRRLT